MIWGADGVGSAAASRWKTQMNENGKVPAWAASLPELDHNEVVGWSGRRGDGSFVVALRHEGEHPDVAARFPLSLEIAREAGAVTEEVWATGRNRARALLFLRDHGRLRQLLRGARARGRSVAGRGDRAAEALLDEATGS